MSGDKIPRLPPTGEDGPPVRFSTTPVFGDDPDTLHFAIRCPTTCTLKPDVWVGCLSCSAKARNAVVTLSCLRHGGVCQWCGRLKSDAILIQTWTMGAETNAHLETVLYDPIYAHLRTTGGEC